MRRTDIRSLGKNNAEVAISRFRGGTLVCAAVGLLCAMMALGFQGQKYLPKGFLYVAVMSAVASLIHLAVSLHTRASNALFRDRDEMMASVRILEAEIEGRRSMQDAR